jgi:hypothetical protein
MAEPSRHTPEGLEDTPEARRHIPGEQQFKSAGLIPGDLCHRIPPVLFFTMSAIR